MTGLAGVAAFVAVADTHSFRKAGTRLAKTASSISKSVARLEVELGVQLLTRTTRSVALTPEGTRYLPHARRALQELSRGRDAIAKVLGEVRGVIRITFPPVLGPQLVHALPKLTEPYPELHLDLHATDRLVLLMQEGFDVALRIGGLEDSTLIARKLGTTQLTIVASPAYLERHGTPETRGDLAAHTTMLFRRHHGTLKPIVTIDGEEHVPRQMGRAIAMNNGHMLLQGAMEGLGLAQVPRFMLGELLEHGVLVEVLPELAPPPSTIRALCAPGRQHTPRIRAVLDWLSDHLMTHTSSST